MYIYICIYICSGVQVLVVLLSVYTNLCIHIGEYAYINTHTHTHTHTHIYIYIYIYIYIVHVYHKALFWTIFSRPAIA